MRQERSREFWVKLVRELALGGSLSEVARRHGVPPSTLHGWRARVGEAQKSRVGELLPVVIKSSPVGPARECAFECGDARLRFSVGTDVRYVAELARALGMQC
jgi:transposase-like protein